MSDRIRLLNPAPGKRGANIERAKYEQIRAAIQHILQEQPGITFIELMDAVPTALRAPFDGSTSWYTTAVKLDMEARGEIRRIPEARPQRLALA